MNVDTDNTPVSNLCKQSYDEILVELLRMHNWNFAIFRQSLNKDASSTPVYEFSNKFVLPTIPILIRVLSTENNTAYKIENNFLLSNESSVKIRFIGKETDPNKYDSLFVEVFASKLAYEVGYAVTSDETRIARVKQDFIESLSLARERDNSEDNDVADTSDSFSSSRTTSFNFGSDIKGITFA